MEILKMVFHTNRQYSMVGIFLRIRQLYWRRKGGFAYARHKLSDLELLKYAVENGMINTALVQEKIEMQKREELLNKHPYKIYQGKDGKWYTYLPDKKEW